MFVSGEMVRRDLGANWICSDLSTSAFLTVYSAPADLWLNWAINKLYVLSNIWIAVGVVLFWHSETNSDANFTIDTTLKKKTHSNRASLLPPTLSINIVCARGKGSYV